MPVLPINTGGPLIGGQIHVNNTSNPSATHISHAGAGGFIEMPTISYRNTIPIGEEMKEDGFTSGRRKFGMVVYVIEDKKYYQLRPKSSGVEVTLAQFSAADPAQQMVWLDPTQTRDDANFDPIAGSGDPNDAWVEVFMGSTIDNNVNNYVLTATGTTNTINGEANFTFNGTAAVITGSLSVSGSVNAQSFYQDSSRTLKTNIQPFEISAINLLDNVNVVEFNYLNDLENKHIGFIAEDTPIELSTTRQNVMDTNSSVGVLIKAVQELSAKVKELESKLK
jgi:outer membrane murein-binding lipoprotein Lpp